MECSRLAPLMQVCSLSVESRCVMREWLTKLQSFGPWSPLSINVLMNKSVMAVYAYLFGIFSLELSIFCSYSFGIGSHSMAYDTYEIKELSMLLYIKFVQYKYPIEHIIINSIIWRLVLMIQRFNVLFKTEKEASLALFRLIKRRIRRSHFTLLYVGWNKF